MRGGRLIYVSVMGYGDALISLQLLQRASPLPVPLLVVGSANTTQVQDHVLGSRFTIAELFPAHSRLYQARTAGIGAMLSDLRRFRAWMSENLRPDDRLLFEKRDWRNQMIGGAAGQRALVPAGTGSAYFDRKRMIEAATGRAIELPSCKRLPRAPTSVLINPSAGAPQREIGAAAMHRLVELLQRRQCRVTVIDPAGRFASAASNFDEYHRRLVLTEATALLRRHDLYIGPDSFFVHLAYYCEVPFFTLLPRRDFVFDFAPPGSRELGNFIGLDEVLAGSTLEQRLGAFAGW